ncbi:MAG: beta strand repeat-containing protein [Burkholderiaceae bacterium]
MALALEITQPDQSIVSKPLASGAAKYVAQAGEKFRIVDENGQPIDGITAIREGQNLVLHGLPETDKLELTDFFEHCENDDQTCVLTMPDGQVINASHDAPLLIAQSSSATKTDATATTPSVTVEEAAGNPAMETSTIALGAIGGLLVAGGLSSGGSDDPAPIDNTPPATTAPAASLEGSDLTLTAAEAANGVTVNGTAEPNSVIVVMIGDVSVETVADGNGQYTATVDGASLPADGTYPVTVTSSGPGGNSAPETTSIGEVTIDTASGGNLAVTDAAATTLSGFAGDDVLVGGNSVSVANGDFNTWDLTGYNSDGNLNSTASGLVYDPTTAVTPDSSIQIDTVPGNPGQPNIGWSILADQDPGGNAPLTGLGDVGRNGFEDGTSGNSRNFARIELITDDVNPGSYLWETVTSNESGGGGLTQTLDTIAGQDYTLSMDVVSPTSTGRPSDSHQTAGTSIEVRWGNETIAFFDATANSDVGAWVTTGGLVAPTVEGGTWTFSNLTADATQTELSLIAYERYGDRSNAFNDGVGLRIGNVSVTGAAGAADQIISGGAGSDLIYGQDGNDVLYGGTASTPDTATDVFVFSMQMDNGTNTIADFDVNADRITLVDVRDVDSTGTLLPGDTRSFTDDVGGTEGADGTATGESLTNTNNINVNDLLASGEQSISVAESGGNTVLTMTGEGGADLGSVTLTGVTGQVGADDSASLNNLINAGLLTFTSDPFSNQLQATV